MKSFLKRLKAQFKIVPVSIYYNWQYIKTNPKSTNSLNEKIFLKNKKIMEKDAIFVKIKLSASNIEKKETECSYCSNKTKKFYSSEQKLKKHIIYDHLNFSRNVQVPTTIIYKYYCPVERCVVY